MKILITGNPEFGLAKSLYKIYPEAMFVSRHNDHDITKKKIREHIAMVSLEYDVFINNSALHAFNQTLLLEEIYNAAAKIGHQLHIINVGSTTDKVNGSRVWMYNTEKKTLRDMNNTMGLVSNWQKSSGPKVSYISFGTLSNNQHKHQDRQCIDIDEAASYIKWIVDQPSYLSINEISIDKMQCESWDE